MSPAPRFRASSSSGSRSPWPTTRCSARHAQAERAGLSPFWALSLPEAVVRFRQGVGRLIRSRRDRGLLVVLGPRM